MPLIIPTEPVCTVIVTVDAPVEIMEDLEAHASSGLTKFTGYPGFVGGALHRSADGTRLVQYLQWRSEPEYRACMQDGRWDRDASAGRFLAHVEAGLARVDVRVFQVVADAGSP